MPKENFKLRDSQKEAIKFVANKRYSFIFGGVGFGKTLTMIYYFKYRPNQRIIVLVHKKEMIKQWKEVIAEHLPEHKNIIISTYSREIVDVQKYATREDVWIKNSKGEKVLRNRKVWKENRIPLRSCDILVIDEIHQLKSTSSDRYKRCKEIKYKQLIGLTGTPINDLEDWLMYFKIAKTNITSKTKFREIFEAKGYNSITGQRYDKYINHYITPNFTTDYVNKDKLNEYLSTFTIEFETHDLVEEVQETNKELFDIVFLNDVETTNTLVLRTSRIKYDNWHLKRQIAHKYTKRLKLNECNKWRNETYIIVTRYKKEEKYILKKIKNSTKSVKKWLESKEPMVLVANSKTAIFTGTDGMQKITNKMIFWSPVSSTIEMRQIVGRINRFGMKEQPQLKIFYNFYEGIIWEKTFANIAKIKNKKT